MSQYKQRKDHHIYPGTTQSIVATVITSVFSVFKYSYVQHKTGKSCDF